MKKVAVLVAPGFEEGETLTIVDILRRAHIECDLVGFTNEITGGHDITVKSDKVLPIDIAEYDMIVLPGGRPGADNLRDSDEVIELLLNAEKNKKFIAAMCAAPIVLDKAGILNNKKFTAYIGYDKKIKSGTFLEDIVVVDGKLITSRGPATVYAFAYALIDVLGGDSIKVKKRMVYTNAFDVEEDKIYG